MKFQHHKSFFTEYGVPEILQDITEAVMKRFTIYQKEDAMYICRLISNEFRDGYGEDNFSDISKLSIPLDHEAAKKAAEHLQRDMWSRIKKEDISELTGIIESGGEVDPALAREGIGKFIEESKEQFMASDMLMMHYYADLINIAADNLCYFNDLTIQKDHIRLDDKPGSWHIIDELPYQNGHTYYLLEPESYEKNYHPIIDEDYNIILDHAFFGFQDLEDYFEEQAEQYYADLQAKEYAEDQEELSRMFDQEGEYSDLY